MGQFDEQLRQTTGMLGMLGGSFYHGEQPTKYKGRPMDEPTLTPERYHQQMEQYQLLRQDHELQMRKMELEHEFRMRRAQLIACVLLAACITFFLSFMAGL